MRSTLLLLSFLALTVFGRLVLERETYTTFKHERHAVKPFILRENVDHAEAIRMGRTPAIHVAHLAMQQHLSFDLLDAQHAKVLHMHDRGNAKIITFVGEKDSLPLLRSRLSVALSSDMTPRAISGHLPRLSDVDTSFTLSLQTAISLAIADIFSAPLSPVELASVVKTSQPSPSTGNWFFVAVPGLHENVRVRRVLHPSLSGIQPAFQMELGGHDVQGHDNHYEVVISAVDGAVLYRRSLHDDVNYRVFASPSDFIPMSGPVADYEPHPTGVPDGSAPADILSVLVSLDYLPGMGLSDVWTSNPANRTSGNNVNAYTDVDGTDGLTGGDLLPAVSSVNTFDYSWSPGSDQTTVTQASSNVVNLFYVNNYLHDLYYEAGFDEVAGNAQLSNYGRGGIENDPLNAEALDFQGTNNANMYTPSDGSSPRMQMYLWTPAQNQMLTFSSVDYFSPNVEIASDFGFQVFDFTANLALADDGDSVTTDLCTAHTGASLAGLIVLADRGLCAFSVKAGHAMNAGATGIIIINNADPANHLFGSAPGLNIAVLSVSSSLGALLKAGVGSSARMFRQSNELVSSSLDNMIVEHEWGHFLHHRLTDSSSQQTGGMSEGWGDFIALLTTIQADDNIATGTFAMGVFATQSFINYGYFGIRQRAYTNTMAKNGLTFKHISDGEVLPADINNPNGGANSQVHNVGEVWCSMLFAAYTHLVAAHGGSLSAARSLMRHYVVAGLKLHPTDATFTESKDAILLAAAAANVSDAEALCDGFAVRGLGSFAESPSRDSTSLVGVVESFVCDAVVRMADNGLLLETNDEQCDEEVWNAGETARLVVSVVNSGKAGEATVWVEETSQVHVLGGSERVVQVGSFESLDVEFELELKDGVESEFVLLTAGVTSVFLNTSEQLGVYVNYREGETSVQDFYTLSGWNYTVGEWAIRWVQGDAHGESFASTSDTRLTLAEDIVVATGGALVFRLEHMYDFEVSGPVNYDGAVLEYAVDGGAWEDAMPYLNTSGQALGSIVGVPTSNPLVSRTAFVGASAGYPNAYVTSEFDLSFITEGSSVQLRLRIGTDEAASAEGWFVKRAEVEGAANLPFVGLVSSVGECGSGEEAEEPGDFVSTAHAVESMFY